MMRDLGPASFRISSVVSTVAFSTDAEDDPFLSREIRAEAARPASFYALQPVRRGPGGVGRLTQDVVLPDR